MMMEPGISAYENLSNIMVKQTILDEETRNTMMEIRGSNIDLLRSLLTTCDDHARKINKIIKP